MSDQLNNITKTRSLGANIYCNVHKIVVLQQDKEKIRVFELINEKIQPYVLGESTEFKSDEDLISKTTLSIVQKIFEERNQSDDPQSVTNQQAPVKRPQSYVIKSNNDVAP